jgi:hypothetical protein
MPSRVRAGLGAPHRVGLDAAWLAATTCEVTAVGAGCSSAASASIQLLVRAPARPAAEAVEEGARLGQQQSGSAALSGELDRRDRDGRHLSPSDRVEEEMIRSPGAISWQQDCMRSDVASSGRNGATRGHDAGNLLATSWCPHAR